MFCLSIVICVKCKDNLKGILIAILLLPIGMESGHQIESVLQWHVVLWVCPFTNFCEFARLRWLSYVFNKFLIHWKLFIYRYERMPSDFMTLELPVSSDQSSQYVHVISSANRTASSVFTTLSRYLFQRRWVWSVQHSSSMQITTQAIGRILSTITKYDCLQYLNYINEILNILQNVYDF